MMSNNTVSNADSRFGPFVSPIAHDQFDFTLLFEQSIFSILPSAALILAAAPRIYHLSQRRQIVVFNILGLVKWILLVSLVGAQIVVLAIWAKASVRTHAATAAATAELWAAMALCALSTFEHLRSLRPSTVINAYLLVTLPLNVSQVRTLWLRHSYHSAAITYSVAGGIKLLLLAVEAVEKQRLIQPQFRPAAPESTTGIYSRSVFWWLNPLFITGYKNILSGDTLLAIDDALLSRNVYKGFQRTWARRTNNAQHFKLLSATLRSVLIPSAGAVLSRLFLIFFRFMQPLLIRSVSEYVAEPVTKFNENKGWGLTAAFGLVYAGLAVSNALYYHQVYRVITMIRGSLVQAIYAKTLRTASYDLNESAAVTLMSNDLQRITDGLSQMHELWASVIEVAIGVWLLFREFGWALVGPLAVTLATVFGTMVTSKRMGAAMGSWMGTVQLRIDACATVLGSVKELKMLGLTQKISAMLTRLRTVEIAESLVARRFLALQLTLANVPGLLGPSIGFVIYIFAVNRETADVLDVPRSFTALSLIILITNPVRGFVFAFGPLIEANACFGRIEKYLVAPEPSDKREVPGEDAASSADRDQSIELQPMHSTRWPSVVVDAESACFGWNKTGLPTIKDFSMNLSTGSATYVVGPVGSGKSTLLRGLLGELPLVRGRLKLGCSTIAYVSQTPWIQHKSVRDNILGVFGFNQAWYDSVCNACALQSDFAILSHGDATMVSSSGHSLSGGQKLRISLARAVYSRCQLLLLDDCFSGIDAANEELIFQRLLGRRGLLRCNGMTVLLTTHAAHRLSIADHIIALAADGTVTESGSYNDLMQRDSYVSKFGVRTKLENEAAKEDDLTKPSIKELAEQQREESAAAVVDSARQVGERQIYRYYISAIGPLNALAFLVFIIIFAVADRISQLWIVLWTSAVTSRGNSVNATYSGAYIAFGVLGLLAAFCIGLHTFTRMVPTAARNLHARLLSSVLAAPLYHFNSTHTGQTLNLFSQDLALIDTDLPIAMMSVCGPIALAVLQVVFICISAAYFTAMLPVVVLVLYFIQRYYLRTSRQIRLLDLEAKAPLVSHFLETLQGLVTIRAFRWQKDFADQQEAILDHSQQPFYLMFCIQRWLTLVLDLIVSAMAVILMAMIVKLRENLDPGFVALALLNIFSFNNNLTAIIDMWTHLETSMGAIARIKNYSERTPRETVPSQTTTISGAWPASGKIVFQDFCAAYSPDSPDVLKGINLTIHPGVKVGICGVSGSGKSSLIGSLFRLLETTAGQIVVDDVNLAQLPHQHVRVQLNAIPQHAMFFKGTIRENIDPLTNATDDEIISALREVGLLDVIAAVQNGLDSTTSLDEILSHGQRQLVCLARAMLRPSNIVVLDEATASVDVTTDQLMQRIIKDKFAGKTIITVAHRLQTIMDYDRIVVMHEGRIVEVGTPKNLLEKANGHFKELWEA